MSATGSAGDFARRFAGAVFVLARFACAFFAERFFAGRLMACSG
jgi:hypothetical protein